MCAKSWTHSGPGPLRQSLRHPPVNRGLLAPVAVRILGVARLAAGQPIGSIKTKVWALVDADDVHDDGCGPTTAAGLTVFEKLGSGALILGVVASHAGRRSALIVRSPTCCSVLTERTRAHDAAARPEGWRTVGHDQHPAGLRCGSISASTGAGKPAAVVGKYSRRSISTTSMARSSGSRPD